MPQRWEERIFLRQRLLAGVSVLMLAMRRTGKTWLCLRIEEDAEKAGFRVAFCNLEGCDDEKAAFAELCNAVEPKLTLKGLAKDRIGTMFRRIVGGKVDVQNFKDVFLRTDWRESVRALLSTLDKDDKPWVIILDELPLFVMKLLKLDRARAANFLSQLRAYRQEFKNVRWLLTGSVGLDVITRRERLGGTINDLERFDLQPLSAEAGRRLLENLNAEGKLPTPFAIGAAEFDHLVQRLMWLSPYYLIKLAGVIRPTGIGEPKRASSDDIDRAFDALLNHANRGYFTAWAEHIDNNFDGPDRDRYRILLSRLSRSADGEKFDTLLALIARGQLPPKRSQLAEALDMLISDGYLEHVEDRYRFRSGLVRDWWRRWEADDDAEPAA
jgi:hypothetical protein